MQIMHFNPPFTTLLDSMKELLLLCLLMIILLTAQIELSMRKTTNTAFIHYTNFVSIPYVVGELRKPITIYMPPCGGSDDC